MPTTAFLKRTEQNVIDSEGTAISSIRPLLSGRSKRTAEFAKEHGKPFIRLHRGDGNAAERLRAFVEENRIKTLNVAGPRASHEPTIGEFVVEILNQAFPN
jgi:hypothetical protein